MARDLNTIIHYGMVVPHLIDDSDGDDEAGLSSNQLGTFRNYFRMSKAQFQTLDRVTPYISR